MCRQKPGSLCMTIWRKDELLIGLYSQEAYKVCLSVCLLIQVFIEVIVDLREVIRDKAEIPRFPLRSLPQWQHLAKLPGCRHRSTVHLCRVYDLRILFKVILKR